MFGSLGGDTANGLPDLAPTGTLLPGGLRRLVAQPFGRPPQGVGKSEFGQSRLAPDGHTSHRLTTTLLGEVVGERLQIR